jgi:lipopolysaccharide cholinephosphotransferase
MTDNKWGIELEAEALIFISCSLELLLKNLEVNTLLLDQVMSSVVFRSREPLSSEKIKLIVSTNDHYKTLPIYNLGIHISRLLQCNFAYALAFSLIYFWEKYIEQTDDAAMDKRIMSINNLFLSKTSKHAIDRFRIYIYELHLDTGIIDDYENLAELIDSSLYPLPCDSSELLNLIASELHGIQYNQSLEYHRTATISIYHWFVEFCKLHHFRFFIIGGNALGAVRNGRMIPWDDDIDVVMRYPDYEMFHAIIAEALPQSYYWSHPYNNPTHPRFFGKIVHDGKCCIDIFPVVKTPDQQFFSKFHFLANKILYRSYIQKIGFLEEINPMRLHAGLFKLFIPLIPRFIILKMAYWNMTRYEKRNKCYKYTSICGRYGFDKELIERVWIEGCPEYLEFEGITSPVFCSYQQFLERQYGDYMRLPDINERESLHVLKISDVIMYKTLKV